jgi:hypothetical protein
LILRESSSTPVRSFRASIPAAGTALAPARLPVPAAPRSAVASTASARVAAHTRNLTADERATLRRLVDDARRTRNGLSPRSEPVGIRIDVVNAIVAGLRERGPMSKREVFAHIGGAEKPFVVAFTYANKQKLIQVYERTQKRCSYEVVS